MANYTEQNYDVPELAVKKTLLCPFCGDDLMEHGVNIDCTQRQFGHASYAIRENAINGSLTLEHVDTDWNDCEDFEETGGFTCDSCGEDITSKFWEENNVAGY